MPHFSVVAKDTTVRWAGMSTTTSSSMSGKTLRESSSADGDPRVYVDGFSTGLNLGRAWFQSTGQSIDDMVVDTKCATCASRASSEVPDASSANVSWNSASRCRIELPSYRTANASVSRRGSVPPSARTRSMTRRARRSFESSFPPTPRMVRDQAGCA